MTGAPEGGDRRRAASSGPPPPRFTADRLEEKSAATMDARRDASGPTLQWPLMSVLIGLVVALGVVATDHFRRGAVLYALCVVAAFVLRMILSEREAGWLAVRTRGVDLLCLGVLAVSLLVFSAIVPSPS